MEEKDNVCHLHGHNGFNGHDEVVIEEVGHFNGKMAEEGFYEKEAEVRCGEGGGRGGKDGGGGAEKEREVEDNLAEQVVSSQAADLLAEEEVEEEGEGEEEAVHNKKEVVEHQLTEESKMLARLAMKPCKDFVAGLLKTFPPVHLPHDKLNTLDLRNTKPGVQLRKLIAIYHPDKVDKVKNGERHFLLCEMITTQLNLRYSKYK